MAYCKWRSPLFLIFIVVFLLFLSQSWEASDLLTVAKLQSSNSSDLIHSEWRVVGNADVGASDVVLVTLAAGTGEHFAISLENKLAYARHHKYHLVYITQHLDHSRHIHWSKIPAVRALLQEGYTYVGWIDIDTMFADLCSEIPPLFVANKSLVVQTSFHSKIKTEVNAGVYFVRNSEWALTFLDEVYQLYSLRAQVAEQGGATEENKALSKTVSLLDEEELEREVTLKTHGSTNSLWIFGSTRNLGVGTTQVPRMYHWAGSNPKPYTQMFAVWKTVSLTPLSKCSNRTNPNPYWKHHGGLLESMRETWELQYPY